MAVPQTEVTCSVVQLNFFHNRFDMTGLKGDWREFAPQHQEVLTKSLQLFSNCRFQCLTGSDDILSFLVFCRDFVFLFLLSFKCNKANPLAWPDHSFEISLGDTHKLPRTTAHIWDYTSWIQKWLLESYGILVKWYNTSLLLFTFLFIPYYTVCRWQGKGICVVL